jgi:glycine cleavage system transcriptional repressor
MQQLIINVIGKSSLSALSHITACISQCACNLLDSRHAEYGTDFSLTMIVSGSHQDIAKFELAFSALCVERDLLCLMRRTTGHQKQNIEQLIHLSFSGLDMPGLMHKVSSVISEHELSVNAIRQQTKDHENGTKVNCKMVLSAHLQADLSAFDEHMKLTLHTLGLHGTISHNINKEEYEYSESW